MKLYHVSYVYHGPAVQLIPRIPLTRAPSEPERPARVCVAPRVGDCLQLTPWRDYHHKLHVYVTEVKHVAKISRDLPRKYVPDWKKWGREEIWLLNQSGYEFKHLGYARMFRAELVLGRPFWYFKRGGEDYESWTVDPSQLTTEGARQVQEAEISRHRATREFMKKYWPRLKLRALGGVTSEARTIELPAVARTSVYRAPLSLEQQARSGARDP